MNELPRSPLRLAFAGFLAMAVAMGFGRFAYTPILPAMVAGLHLGKAQAGWIAAANFAGYLLGALIGASPLKGRPRDWLLGGLAVSVLTTLAMGASSDLMVMAALRFVSGLASAAVLVFSSTLVLGGLAASGRPGLSAVHFAGVGAGMALSGALISGLEGAGATWSDLWYGVGALGAVMAAGAALLLSVHTQSGATLTAETERGEAAPDAARRRGFTLLLAAYGLFGFGYVVTATFLMVIVRASPQARAVEPAVWVVVGLAAVPSIWLWMLVGRRISLQLAFAVSCLVEAASVAVSVLWPTVPGALIAAVGLGGTYMAITALGLALARELAPAGTSRALAAATAAFAFGQMLGPLVGGALAERTGSFAVASLLAAASLVVAATLAAIMPRRH